MESRPWDNGTRLLHATLAVTVLAEMSVGVIVSRGTHPQWVFLHSMLGIATLLVIIVNWMWSWARRDLGVIFPWNGSGLRRVGREAIGLFQGKLPSAGDVVGLSSFMHGVGLLAVSGMAVTGLWIYIVFPNGYGLFADSAAYGLLTTLGTLHLWLSYVVWVYVGGHILFAALQQLLGNDMLRHFTLIRH